MRGDTANIRTLSARYIADLQDHWEIHGQAALDEYREKFVDRYVENFSLLARVIRVEADVKRSMATPKTVDEALAELESKVGTKGGLPSRPRCHFDNVAQGARRRRHPLR